MFCWQIQGHSTGNFEKNTPPPQKKKNNNNNKAWIKISEVILSILGRLLGKMYLFLTPSKTDGRVPSQQGAPMNLQPDLPGSFPADVRTDIAGTFGQVGGGGGVEGAH